MFTVSQFPSLNMSSLLTSLGFEQRFGSNIYFKRFFAFLSFVTTMLLLITVDYYGSLFVTEPSLHPKKSTSSASSRQVEAHDIFPIFAISFLLAACFLFLLVVFCRVCGNGHSNRGTDGIQNLIDSLPFGRGRSGLSRNSFELLQRVIRSRDESVRGASQSAINALPVHTYTAPVTKSTFNSDSSSDVEEGYGNGVHVSSDQYASDLPVQESDASSNASPSHSPHHKVPTCSICLTAYQAGDSLRTLPCLHMFHTECVDPWLLKKSTCPLCKHSMR